MDYEKNPFSAVSEDEIQKLDEVLRSDQAKVMLDSKVISLVSGEMSEVSPSTIASDLVGLSDLDNLVLPSPSDPSPYDDESANLVRQITQDDIAKSLGHGFVFLEHNYCRNLDFELPLPVDETACEVTILNTPEENEFAIAKSAEDEFSVINFVENHTLATNFANSKPSTTTNLVDSISSVINLVDRTLSSTNLADSKPSVINLRDNESLAINLVDNISSVTNLVDCKPLASILADNVSALTNLVDCKPLAPISADNESAVTNLVDCKLSTTNLVASKSSVTDLADNEFSVTDLADNKSLVTDLADKKSSVTDLADNKSSVTNLADNESSTKNFAHRGYSVTNFLKNKSSVTNFVDTKSSVPHSVKNKSSVIDIVANESLKTDSVEDKYSQHHSVETESLVPHHIKKESLVFSVENQATATQSRENKSAVTRCLENEPSVTPYVENDSLLTYLEKELVAVYAETDPLFTCAENDPLLTCAENKSSAAQVENSSAVHCVKTKPEVTHLENEISVVDSVEAITPRRRSQRQIAKVTREKIEKENVHISEEKPEFEDTVLNNLQQTIHFNPEISTLLVNFKKENIERSTENLINEFGEQIKESSNISKRNTGSMSKNDVNPINVPAVVMCTKRGAIMQQKNKTARKEISTSPKGVREVSKIINAKDIKAIVARSKTQRKSSESSTVDDNWTTSPKSSTKNIKNIKRRTSDSTSSTSSEMSLSPLKSIKGKKSISKNQSNTNGSTSENMRRESLSSRKLSNTKEAEKKPNGDPKPRKKSLSFSEEKNDANSEKKRHLSSSGKESFSVEVPITKSKIIKPKKRNFKSDSLNLDLLGPALFSQPHIMGKVKSEELSDAKESLNKDIVSDATSKPDRTGSEESELDLIKAEVKTEQPNLKQEENSSLLEKTLLNSKVNRSGESKTELTKTKSNFIESNFKPTDSSCVIPASTTMEKEKSKPISSGKSETKTPTEIIKPVQQTTKEKKPSSFEKNTELTLKSSNTSENPDPSMPPERKSQRNIQKRKRIYEDDSDFEEPPVVYKKSAAEITEIESKLPVKRSQRQKSIFQIENECGSGDEDVDDTTVQTTYNEVKKPDSESENESDSTTDDDTESSEEEKAVDSEDDPDKLWCICRQPHNNKFMICCDKCEDWFHGTCVGITRKIGQMLEDEKKEWICPNCKKGITRIREKRSSVSSKAKKQEAAAVAKTLQKQTQNNAVQRKQTRQLPKGKTSNENESEAQEEEMKLLDKSLKQSPVQSSDIGNNTKSHILRKIDKGGEALVLMKRDPRSKKSLLQKQTPSPKPAVRKEGSPEKVAKGNASLQKIAISKGNANTKVQSMSSEKASSSKPTDIKNTTQSTNCNRSLARSNSQNSASEKPSEKTQKKRLESVSSDNTSKTKSPREHGKKKTGCIVCSQPTPLGSIYCGQACLEKYTAESLHLLLNQKGFLKDNENWKTKKISVMDKLTKNFISGDDAPVLGEIVSWLKSHPSCEIVRPFTKKESYQKIELKPQLPERIVDERGESSIEAMQKNVRNALKQTLIDRCKSADDFKMPEDEIQKIAFKIEEELHNSIKDTSRYMKKYRSLIFNIKDSRNMGLFRKILSGEIAPDRLVKMSTEELAAPELAQWRAMENQHSLDMIKRMQVDQPTSAGLRKKTHKGDIEIEDELTVREPEIDKEIAVSPPRPPVETIEVTPEKKEKEPEKKEVNDTTNSHRSHLFDLNCKICTGKIAPPPLDESLPKKVRVAHSISIEQSSPKSFSSSDKLISPITPGPKPTLSLPVIDISEDSADREPTSTTHSSPDSSTLQLQQTPTRKKSQFSVWKGFVAMQDVAKFFTNAYKVSGPTDFLHEDIPDVIQVCGRIVPDQVWDYLSKIKQSGNKELIIIRFQAANDEERAPYNHFYTYLYSRKRYGVVGCSSKMVKDFYIFPLAAHNPVPTVLMPFDGPGLPSQRPHLLLGVLVRHKTRQSVSGTPIEYELEGGIENERSFTPPLEARSYTPPIDAGSYTPPLPSKTTPGQEEVSSSLPFHNTNKPQLSTPSYIPVVVSSSSLKRTGNEEYDPNEPSYTPPRLKMPKLNDSLRNDDEKPYDPEQDCLSSHTNQSNLSNTPNSPVIFAQLLKKITDNNGTAADSLVPDTISDSSSKLQHERLVLDDLTRRFEEADKKVISLASELETKPVEDQSAQSSTPEDSIVIPNINASGMSSFLDLPQNLQEILNSVQMKMEEQASPKQSSIKDIDQRCLLDEPKSDVDFRCLTRSEKDEDIRQVPSYSPVAHSSFDDERITDTDDRESSQGATPPLICEDENSSSSELRPSDPRIKLQTNFVDSTFSSEEMKKVSLSDMSTFELMERAQKELEAIPTADSQNDIASSSVSAEGIALEQYQLKSWAQYTEPPPPGIDPSELPPAENVSFPTTKVSPESLYASQSENIAPVTSFPPQPSPTTPAFSVSIPPPGFPLSTPPPTIDGHKLFPPPPFMPPPPPILPSALVVQTIETIDQVNDRYLWPPDNPPSDSDWQESPRRWRDRNWEQRPYRRSQPEHRQDHQDDFSRSRFRRDFYPNDYTEETPSRSWQEGDRDAHFERNERRWHRRPFREHRHNDNKFRGRRNFKRHRD